MNLEERRDFVKKHRTAVFGQGRKDDGPAKSIVYYVSDGDDLLVAASMPAHGLAVRGLPVPREFLAPDDIVALARGEAG